MIRKEIANSKKLSLCCDAAKVIYFMMLPHTDVEGRVKACPEIVKGQYLTMLEYSGALIQSCLEELHKVGLIVLYKIGTDQFAQYTRFKDFQTLNPKREAKTKIPPPDFNNSGLTPDNSGLNQELSGDAYSGVTPEYSGSIPISSSSSSISLIKNNKKNSERPLDLELMKTKIAGFELALHEILPARNKGERKTYRRIFDHVAGQIKSGQLDFTVFDQILEFAKKANIEADNPRAWWVSQCKVLTGFRGQSEVLKKLSFDQEKGRQLAALGAAK
jgi:hypothetical protein